MYAIIATGGKQCPVEPGKKYWIEKLDQAVGSEVVFDEVLACRAGDDFKIGAPTVANVRVVAEVVEHGRAAKVEIIKFKRRKHSMKRAGHRQAQTCVLIKNIDGVVAPKAAEKKTTKAATTAKKSSAAKTSTSATKEAPTKKPKASASKADAKVTKKTTKTQTSKKTD